MTFINHLFIDPYIRPLVHVHHSVISLTIFIVLALTLFMLTQNCHFQRCSGRKRFLVVVWKGHYVDLHNESINQFITHLVIDPSSGLSFHYLTIIAHPFIDSSIRLYVLPSIIRLMTSVNHLFIDSLICPSMHPPTNSPC